jgi:2'-5' RNA ligase
MVELYMRAFYITTDFSLTVKPDWLDSFRTKYDDPGSYHVTLKNAVLYKEEDIQTIKNNIFEISLETEPFIITFDELYLGKTAKGHTIMIKAPPDNKIFSLQQRVQQAYIYFNEYLDDLHKSFDTNFNPHITIARHLNDTQFETAKNEMHSNLHCEATINNLTLTFEETEDAKEILASEVKTSYPFNQNL